MYIYVAEARARATARVQRVNTVADMWRFLFASLIVMLAETTSSTAQKLAGTEAEDTVRSFEFR